MSRCPILDVVVTSVDKLDQLTPEFLLNYERVETCDQDGNTVEDNRQDVYFYTRENFAGTPILRFELEDSKPDFDDTGRFDPDWRSAGEISLTEDSWLESLGVWDTMKDSNQKWTMRAERSEKQL